MISLFENNGGTLFVGIRQGGAFNLGKAQVVKLMSLTVQAEYQVSQAFAAAELTVSHSTQL